MLSHANETARLINLTICDQEGDIIFAALHVYNALPPPLRDILNSRRLRNLRVGNNVYDRVTRALPLVTTLSL